MEQFFTKQILLEFSSSSRQLLSEKAKQKFKKALDLDPEFERARKNLEKLTMAVPMTL